MSHKKLNPHSEEQKSRERTYQNGQRRVLNNSLVIIAHLKFETIQSKAEAARPGCNLHPERAEWPLKSAHKLSNLQASFSDTEAINNLA
jgi:hypothetical protein